jgi:hypothetical protein
MIDAGDAAERVLDRVEGRLMKNGLRGKKAWRRQVASVEGGVVGQGSVMG